MAATTAATVGMTLANVLACRSTNEDRLKPALYKAPPLIGSCHSPVALGRLRGVGLDRYGAPATGEVNRRYEDHSASIATTSQGLPAWAELLGGYSVEVP